MTWDGERERRDSGGDSIAEGAPSGVRSRVARRYGGARPAAAPTIHDAATTAVEAKGAGRSVDPTVSATVGAHLGSDFSAVRVHDDALSQQATEAMGARAFAYGGDVFLGPGESDRNLGLMAHELTHVAQQGAAGQRMPQRQVQVGDAASPAEHQADQVAAAVTGGAPPAQLIVEQPPVGPGQMLKSQFFEQLRAAATAAAAQELGPVYAGIGCPYIEQTIGRYAMQPAATGEAMLRRLAPGARGARSASDLLPAVTARVVDGVRSWRDTGQPPADLAAAAPEAAAAAAAPATAQALRAPGGEDTLASLEAELGPGAPLDGGTAQRMSSALGTEVSHARIHTGPVASRKAAEAGAAAFTVGSHIVMAASAPAAGSLPGDALLAHELAHAAQQRDASQDPVARRKPIGLEDAAAEGHADAAAAGAVAGLHGGQGKFALLAQRMGGAFKSGLQLQRCPQPAQQAQAPAPTVVSNHIVDGPYAWQSRFDVTLGGNDCRVVIKPKLVPDAGVTPVQLADVKQRARAAFTRLFDNQFILTDTGNNQQYNLHTDVQFVDSGEHYTVALHVGPDGNGNLTNWYTGNYDETLAHELGHQLGLKDEYIDATAPSRATGASPGVFTDHSIMGNYLAEGRPQAGVQLRHGQTLGNEIGGATGHTFTVARRP